jgi:hypothetical protein
MKPFVTLEETEEILGLTSNEVRTKVRNGELREFRDAGRIFFKTEDVEELRKKNRRLVDHRDFTKDGKTDWNAYHEAKINNGEVCFHCGAPIVLSKGSRTLCSDCQYLHKPDELSHANLVRCPQCSKTFNPGDSDRHRLYEDGEHQICCDECDHEFEITTHVSHTFVSPPLLKQG